jgi:hypothetical protein
MGKIILLLFIFSMVLNSLFASKAIGAERFHVNVIDYSSIAPTNFVLEDNYGGIGIDHLGWVYHAIDGYYIGVEIEDSAVFRFNTYTGEKEFLGSLRNISAAEGNLLPGEAISKIHAPIYEHNNLIYFASHPFHNKDDVQRGGHFYSFDPRNRKWTDLSKFDPNGISTPGQGIIAMEVLRKHDKLVGFTFPKGEIVTFDLKTNKTTNHGRPISNDPWNVSRHIIATDAGKVYFSYSGYNKALYEFDTNTEIMKPSGFILDYGWLSGVAYNAAGTNAYFVDWLGSLYSLNVITDEFSRLGKVAPDNDSNYIYRWFHGLIMSKDDKKLYSLPKMNTGSEERYILYEYTVETQEKKQAFITDLDGHVVGGVSSLNGYIYFHNHFYDENYAKLIQIFVNQGALCDGDFNGDGDIDGTDLAHFMELNVANIAGLAANYGLINCP